MPHVHSLLLLFGLHDACQSMEWDKLVPGSHIHMQSPTATPSVVDSNKWLFLISQDQYHRLVHSSQSVVTSMQVPQGDVLNPT